MPAATAPLTVEDYAKLAPTRGGRWELRHGEAVQLTFPTQSHVRIQRRLRVALEKALSGAWVVDKEVPFRPYGENEVWSADVAVVAERRWSEAEPGGWLPGSPELVAEVLSPSNTASEMLDRERVCFAGGCQEFWTLDPALRIAKVTRADGTSNTYEPGQEIPLTAFGGGTLSFDLVFE